MSMMSTFSIEMLERAIDRVAIVGRPAVGSRLALRRRRFATAPSAATARTHEALTAVHRLVVDERVIAAVHRHEELPFLFRTTLAEHARDRMARRAQIGRRLVRFVRVVDRAPLFLERDRPQLGGREPLMIRDVFKDAAGVFRREGRVVQRDHPLDRALPVLRRRAAIRDAGHPALVVGFVASAAARTHERVVDWNAVVAGGLRRWTRRVLAMRRRGHSQDGQSARNDKSLHD
jgi:hypothetical protein